jgi:hypothetical protein
MANGYNISININTEPKCNSYTNLTNQHSLDDMVINSPKPIQTPQKTYTISLASPYYRSKNEPNTPELNKKAGPKALAKAPSLGKPADQALEYFLSLNGKSYKIPAPYDLSGINWKIDYTFESMVMAFVYVGEGIFTEERQHVKEVGGTSKSAKFNKNWLDTDLHERIHNTGNYEDDEEGRVHRIMAGRGEV